MKRRPTLFRKRHPPTGAQPGTLVLDPEAVPPRIRRMTYSPAQFDEQSVTDITRLAQQLDPELTTWVDVQGLGDEALLRDLAAQFHIHPLALEDLVNVPQRPKIEVYADHLLLITRMARTDDTGRPEREQLSLIVGSHYVLSVQERYGDVFDPVRARIRQGGPVFRASGAEYLAYALIDATIDGYYPVLEGLSARLEELDENVITRPERDDISRIHELKRELLAIRRTIWPTREMLQVLTNGGLPHITDRTTAHWRDCTDHCMQLLDVVETYREVAGGLMDVYLSTIANRQNEVMKTLTVIASIFIPLTFLAGIYGMNFEHMPELHYRWSYPVLMALMIAIAGGMLAYFRYKGWLGGPSDPGAP